MNRLSTTIHLIFVISILFCFTNCDQQSDLIELENSKKITAQETDPEIDPELFQKLQDDPLFMRLIEIATMDLGVEQDPIDLENSISLL